MKKVFRKLHLWLSVPFGIFITLICFSGSMLVFEKEISESCRRDLYFVREVREKPLPIDRLMERVAASLPDSVSATSLTVSPDPERTWQVALSQPRRASLYVDPYTGEVTGRSERLPFFDTMFHLHRWMMGSSSGFGKLLVGLSTLALVLILVTGLLMWLTNRNKPLAKSLKISFTKGWPRFWHDLHVAGGIYATVFLLALALTGLTWSFSWYRNGFYRTFGVETSAGGGHGPSAGEQSANGRGERAVSGDRAVAGDRASGRDGRGERTARGGDEDGARRSGRADAADTTATRRFRGEGFRGEGARDDEGGYRGGRSRRGERGEGREDRARRSPYRHWQSIYEQLAQEHPAYRQITLSDGSASVVPAGRRSLRAGDRFEFDARSGRITATQPYAGQDRSAKVRGGVYTVHVGSWGGLLTRILTLLAALLGATLPLTGYYLWIRRLVKGHAHPHDKA